MTQTDQKELVEFAAGADAWFAENVVHDPGFRLPLTFMEVGEDRQFDFLRDWQRKVWEAGYLGAARGCDRSARACPPHRPWFWAFHP